MSEPAGYDRPAHAIHPVYHEDYDLDLGAHVFPSRKFRIIHDRLISSGLVPERDFRRPEPAPEEDLLRVHEAEWIRALRDGTLSDQEIVRLEIPVSASTVEAFILAAGGTTLAARLALADRVGYNVGGGFHHAFPGHGEGFCAIHDVAVALRRLQADGAIKNAMVIDCDVHQGNGTAAIFADDRSVFTVSLHQFRNYPAIKPPSDIDVDLEDGIGDGDYLDELDDALRRALGIFSPDLIAYVAGADPYAHDQLGGLSLTLDGLKQRDRLVFDAALDRGVPVVVTLAGGYALDVNDTVAIHVGTLVAARESLERSGSA